MCKLGSLSMQALSKVSGLVLTCARWWSVQLPVCGAKATYTAGCYL